MLDVFARLRSRSLVRFAGSIWAPCLLVLMYEDKIAVFPIEILSMVLALAERRDAVGIVTWAPRSQE